MGTPPATALYWGPRSKRGGRTDTPKIQRAVNFQVAYGAPRIPPPHLLRRHLGDGEGEDSIADVLSMPVHSTAARMGPAARCSKPQTQSILSCRPEFLNTPVDSDARRTGPAARCTKPNIESISRCIRAVLRTPVHSRPGGTVQ